MKLVRRVKKYGRATVIEARIKHNTEIKHKDASMDVIME